MQIRNISTAGDLDVPDLGQIVEAGQVVEVPDELGERMLAQSDVWAPVKGQKGKVEDQPVVDEISDAGAGELE